MSAFWLAIAAATFDNSSMAFGQLLASSTLSSVASLAKAPAAVRLPLVAFRLSSPIGNTLIGCSAPSGAVQKPAFIVRHLGGAGERWLS
ncbi:hypothetical protein ACVW0I_001490 [Bradyrhizobium sp. LM6.11]